MNSISYLDSILTRSLTSSRSGSGTATPANADAERQHGPLNRRASDYSLSREREREKRKLAASLGLTSLDSTGDHRHTRNASSKSSRAGSARHSEAEQITDRSARERKSQARESESASAVAVQSSSSRHPKSYSEGNAVERQKLRRAGSTPAAIRTTPSRGWSSLWGFGNFLENTGSYDSYSRRTSTHSLGAARARQQASSAAIQHGRRASTGDADAALAGFAPDALLSEREREDVVEFEGYDPDDDLNPVPQAPPSTPFPGTQAKEGEKGSHDDASCTSEASSTAARLSSLLFGALNPLTDDYFGPQPSQGRPTNRRRASEASEKKRKSERARRSSHVSKDSQSEASSSGHGHERKESSASKLSEKETSSETSHGMPTDPPPPYSDVRPSDSSSSLLLASPIPNGEQADPSTLKLESRRDAASSSIARGAKRTFEFLRRLLLMILLTPYRLYQYGRRASKRRMVEAHSVHESPYSATATPVRRPSNKGFQTQSQAERPSAARHMAGWRASGKESEEEGVGGEGDKKTKGLPQDALKPTEGDSDDEEVVTEDQAAERAIRRARRDALRSQEGAVPHQQRSRASSRLLPNPHPVDPLLAHDRNAKARSQKAETDEREQNTRRHEQLRIKEAHAGRAAVVNRGPLSSLIHHSPKVLVLDLDETLIHSTSRSPTWSALADKSKSRLAVTTGGSLLGLEGLGGVLGLRGQVGVRPHQVEVVLDGRSIIYHVYKRPHVETFLRKVASWYHVVVFTASVQEYADPVIDWLDQGRGLISARLFRESCTFRNGSYYKNLSLVDSDLSRICLVDNSPASYMINQANGIPIEGWTHDPNDECLLDLLPVLDSLRFASDVRHILGIRGFSDPALKPVH